MAEEENIAQELHGNLTQMLRTALSGGLQMTEQRARQRQHEAEAERRIATETARQLEERTRAEREANAFLAQQSIIRGEAERAGHAGRAVGTAVETAAEHGPTAFPIPVDEALAQTRQNSAEQTAKACHQRERGASRPTADLGR